MKRVAALAVPLLVVTTALAGPATVGGRVAPDGTTEIGCDLPAFEHLKNVGGRDGSGLCVYTSVEHAGRWQNVEALRGFQQKMRAELGGGWPEKLDRMLARYAPGVAYVQYVGNDPGILELALATGRMPAVTYGYSERYGGRVAHMVNLVHFDERWACVLDNNFPGADRYEWMPRDEFVRRWKLGGGGWAVVLLAPPPPPPIDGGQRMNAFLLTTALALGAWGPGGCGPVGPKYEWKTRAGDPDRAYLYRNGVLQGAYDYRGACYRPITARGAGWGTPARPPVTPPGRPPTAAAVPNFGLDRDKSPCLKEGKEWLSLSGRPADPRQARAALAGGTLVDDRHKLRLTVIGTAADRQRVLDDLARHPALAGFRDRVLVQAYPPEAWAVTGIGLPSGGAPTVVVQAAPGPAGKAAVLHVQADYRDGADGLAGALRKVDPNFDRTKDRDLRKDSPAGAGAPWQPRWADLAWAGGGASLVLMLQYLLPVLVRWWAARRNLKAEELTDLLQALLEKLNQEEPKGAGQGGAPS